MILVNGGEGLRKSIDINDEDHPVAGQVMGSEPDDDGHARPGCSSRRATT